MKRTAFLAFLFLASGLFAQNITINGTGKNINGQHIRLFVSEDNFSGLKYRKAMYDCRTMKTNFNLLSRQTGRT